MDMHTLSQWIINGSPGDNTALYEFKCKAGAFKMLALMKQQGSIATWKEVYNTFYVSSALLLFLSVIIFNSTIYNVYCI